MSNPKEMLVKPLVEKEDLAHFVQSALDEGVRLFICSQDEAEIVRSLGGVVFAPSENADVFLVSSIDEASLKKNEGKKFAIEVKIEGAEDIATAVSAAKIGAEALLVETGDWKIIPLENLIADIHKVNTRVYAKADSLEEIPTLLSVLELGVDGVVLSSDNVNDVMNGLSYFSSTGKVNLIFAKVTEVKNLGIGDRACIDTASILDSGEGFLVGSQVKTLFLVHNESSGSKFTSPRPFRVNAGSIHSYILVPEGKTRYLSELETGHEVLVVDKKGNTRTVVVGRVKIERRPLTLVKVKHDEGVGSILLQNAETIPLIGRDDMQIPVTHLKVGDEILVRVEKSSARHFGKAVEAFMLEK